MNDFDSYFMLVGSIINRKGTRSQDIFGRVKIQFGTVVMKDFKKIFRFQDVSVCIKIRLMQAIVFTVIAYVNENWTLMKKDKKNIVTFQLRYKRKFLRIQ